MGRRFQEWMGHLRLVRSHRLVCPLKVLSAAASNERGRKEGHSYHSTQGSSCYLSLFEVPVQHGWRRQRSQYLKGGDGLSGIRRNVHESQGSAGICWPPGQFHGFGLALDPVCDGGVNPVRKGGGIGVCRDATYDVVNHQFYY